MELQKIRGSLAQGGRQWATPLSYVELEGLVERKVATAVAHAVEFRPRRRALAGKLREIADRVEAVPGMELSKEFRHELLERLNHLMEDAAEL
jgi:hypothetical protein